MPREAEDAREVKLSMIEMGVFRIATSSEGVSHHCPHLVGLRSEGWVMRDRGP